jgi:excinuclease ABC subunit B
VASNRRFELASQYRPAGDQPQAIDALTEGVRAGEREQVLLSPMQAGSIGTPFSSSSSSIFSRAKTAALRSRASALL